MASTKLQKFKYNSHTEFLDLRERLSGKDQLDFWRCGGSTVGDVLGVGYTPRMELFYNAVGWWPRDPVNTLETHRGKVLESVIYNEYFKYIDPNNPTGEAYLSNYWGPKRVYRTATKQKHIYFNPKYPQLYYSPDYTLPKSKYNKRAILEIKSPTGRSMEKWEDGIPPQYKYQVWSYMMGLEMEYGELLMLKDATYPELFVFEPNKERYQEIDHATREFEALIIRGKQIVHSKMPSLEKEQALAMIAPDPDGSDRMTDALKEKHKPENAKLTVDGTDEQFATVVDYLKEKERIKDLQLKNSVDEQKIRSWFYDGIGYINFAPGVQISYVSKLNVPKRILRSVG